MSDGTDLARLQRRIAVAFFLGAVLITGTLSVVLFVVGRDTVVWENTAADWRTAASPEALRVYDSVLEAAASQKDRGALVQVAWPETGAPDWLRLRAMKSGRWFVDGTALYRTAQQDQPVRVHGEFRRPGGERVLLIIGDSTVAAAGP